MPSLNFFPFDIFPIKIKWSDPQVLFILLPVATLELIGMLLVCVGVVDDLGILDSMISVIVWPWLLLKGSYNKPSRKGFNMGRAVERQFICSLIEFFPLLGTILPMWSYSVYIVLKEELISEEEERDRNKRSWLKQQYGGGKAGKGLVKK